MAWACESISTVTEGHRGERFSLIDDAVGLFVPSLSVLPGPLSPFRLS